MLQSTIGSLKPPCVTDLYPDLVWRYIPYVVGEKEIKIQIFHERFRNLRAIEYDEIGYWAMEWVAFKLIK
jgi:hypothetical protein